MKVFLILSHWLLLFHLSASAQRSIYDKHIVHQQERMVHKHWDKDKFTPKRGFLGLNPNYWLTWAWHPNYPKKDHRPLGPAGMQTQRLALVAAMQQATDVYKLHTDTLSNIAISEIINYSGAASGADPLWLLYYKHELEGLIKDEDLLNGVEDQVREYLVGKGIFQWYLEERLTLKERLKGASSTVLDRGSRILTYHRLLLEYRELLAIWESAGRNAAQYIALAGHRERLQDTAAAGGNFKPGRTDLQIADDILAQSKL